MQDIYSYDWPGNIRELQSAIRRFVTVGDLNIHRGQKQDYEKSRTTYENNNDFISLSEALEQFEKEYIRRALSTNNCKKGQTAGLLEISPRTLLRKMKKTGLS